MKTTKLLYLHNYRHVYYITNSNSFQHTEEIKLAGKKINSYKVIQSLDTTIANLIP